MEPWGEDEKVTERALERRSQGEVSSSDGTSVEAKRGRKTRIAVLVAGALALMAGGTFYKLQKAGTPRAAGRIQKEEKGALGQFAENLRKGTSLFGAAGKPAANSTARMSGTPLSLPLFFEANRGQTDARVKFLARSGGYTLFVAPTETIFAGAETRAPRGGLSPRSDALANRGERAVLRMKLLESNPGAELSGIKELPGKVNYLIGNNPKNWHTGVPLYEEVRSREVYPGIDLVYHGDQQRLEYDFQVAPGADPQRIRFKIGGADKVAVDENGDLVLRTGKNEFRMRKPVIYQPEGEWRQPVDGGFSVQAGKLVAFHVGAYDKKKMLVIDPTIIFATFLGAAGIEASGGMDLDVTNPAAPKLFVSGSTSDVTTFTETSSLLGTAGSAGDYAFVAKIDTTTTGAASLNFLTFLGGSLVFTGGTAPCQNFATDLKVDASGGAGQVEAVVLGLTNCRDFPVTFGGPTTGTDDLFLTRLTPSGAAIDNSTLLGGNGSQGITTSNGGSSLFVNQEGTVVLTGSTTSTNLPTTANAYSVSFNNGTPGGFNDCYISKLDRSFNILYLTYLNVGGSTTSTTSVGCGVGSMDAAGKIYFGGNIVSATAFSLINGGAGPNGFQTTFTGTPGTTPNGFVAVLDPSQSGLNAMTYASYIGGGAGVVLRAGTVDLAHGMTVVVGDAISGGTTNIPLLNALQSTNNAPASSTTGMITVIDATKTGAASLVASSYLGGTTNVGFTSVRSVAIDSVPGNPPTQRIVVGGHTTATAFPTMNPLQAALVGSQDAFVSMLSVPSPGSTFNMTLLFSTYLGGGATIPGQSGDSVRNLIADPNHQVYALGRTTSANFFGNTSPATTVNGFQTTCASCGSGTPADDLAIFVLSPQSGTNVPDLTVSKSHSGSFAQGQTGAQYSITVTNSGTGPTVGTVSLTDSLPSGLTATAMTGSGWSCSLGTLVCTRADALGAGMFYPLITLTVNVAPNAPPSVTNTVTVSGGSETNTGNDTASDPTTITSVVGACTNNYIGATGGSWGTPANWSTGLVPISTDVACIPSGITVLVNTGLAAANQTISGLSSSGTLTFSAGPLTVANNSVANIINLNGGTLAFNGQLTVSGAFTETTGIFAGTGEVDLNGPMTWSSGTICSALTGGSCAVGTVAKLSANGGITFPSGASAVLNSRALTNNGTTTISGTLGSLSVVNGAVINNVPGAVWNYTNDSNLVFSGGGTTAFNNAGTFEKTAGTGTSTVTVPFHNTGTVLGNSGTISFTGGGNCGSSCSGTYTPGTSGTIAFGGGLFAQSGPLGGTGTLNFNGATMDFGTGVVMISSTTVNISSGTLAGAAPGVIDFEIRPNWTGGTICSSLSGVACVSGNNGTVNATAGINFPASANVVLNNRTLNNSGIVTWSGATGSMDVVSGAVINNLLNSVWNLTNDSTLVFGGGTAVAFNNAGTFEKTSGTATSTVSVPYHNSGMVMGNSGTLSFTGGGNCGSSCSGTYTAGTSGTIAFGASAFAQSGPINGTGTVNFSGAAMNFGTGTETISTTNVNFSGGILAGGTPGVLNFSTLLNWTGGTMCSSISGTSCIAGTNATTNANAGINFPTSANVVLNGRVLNNNATATWSGNAGSMDVVNGAIINNVLGSVWNYTNDSNLVFGGGASPVLNNGGTFEKTGGTGTTSVTLSFNNTGTVLGNSTTLTFVGGGNCGSTCPGTFTAGTGGAITFSGGIFAQSGPINGGGTVNFAGATMDFGTGTVTISPTTVNITSGVLGGAAPGIVNFSTAPTWTGGTMCSTLSGSACIAGSTATTNLSAGITFATSASAVLNSRTLNNNGTATWTGTAGSLDMVSGAVVNNSSVWNYTNDSSLSYGGGAVVAFNNTGNFTKTGGTGTTAVTTPFNNSGNVNGNSGIISFTAGGNCGSVCSGAFAATTGGNLSFPAGTYPVSGAFSGAGTMNFNGGTMTLTGPYSVTGPTTVAGGTVNFNEASPVTIAGPLNFTSGTITGTTSTLNLPGLLTWSGGTLGLPGTTNANGGIAFPNIGAMVFSNGTLNTPAAVTFAAGGSGASFLQSAGAVINNTGTWNLQGDDFVSYNGGAVTTFNNNAGGVFEKTGGTNTSQISTIFNNNGTVTVGAASGSATLAMVSGSCTTVAPCTGSGSWNVLSGYTLAFTGGTYNLSGPISGAGAVNFNGATVSLTGTYGVTGATNVSSAVNFNEASPVTIGGPLNLTGGTIAGSTSVLNLSGLLTWSGGTLSLPGNTNATGGIAFPNTGAMVLSNGTLSTPAAVTFAAGGSGASFLQSAGAIVNNTGTWNLQNDSFVGYNGGAQTTFNNNAGGIFEKTGGTNLSQISETFNNAGTVLANAANLFFTTTFTQTGGTTALGGGSIQCTSTHPLTLQGGSLTGSGTVQGDVTNTGGSVAPGSAAAAGAISVSGSGLGLYAQSGTGAYNVKIGGTAAGQFDTLTISGAATLGGPLNVSLINSFSPALGNTFTILTAGSITGTFGTTNLPALTAGLGWQVSYTGTTVVLSVVSVSTPIANLNPGSLTFPNTIVNTAAAVQKIQLQNTGTGPLIITSIQPTGADAANYSYTADAVQPCPISPATLANGASCLLDIGFLPLTAGTHNNAQISVTDNSGSVAGSIQTVGLSGTGIALNSIAVTPAPANVPQGGTLQFTATGTYSDNSTQNLTSSVTWASGTTTVATIDAAGLATGVAPGTSNITAKQGAVTSPAAVLTVTGATHFAVSSPGSILAGTPFSTTIFAEDQFNNVVPGYTGTVHFTSSDPLAVLPANGTLTNGSGSFQVTLKTVGSQTYTATDTVTSSITGTSNPVTVGTGAVTHFQVSLSGSPVVGSLDNLQVLALDQFGNAVTTYAGTVHFTSTDPAAVLPANTTLTGGVGTFSVTFKTVGSQSVTATDTATSTITGTSNAIGVVSGAATHFQVAMPGLATVGVATSVTVAALDQFNNLATGYTGTVHFTSTDASATLPANTTLTNGAGTFPVTFKTAGSQTVTATDTVTATITGTSNTNLVSTGTATHLLLATLPSVTAGTQFALAVEALDQFNNIVTTYSGTVHFTSSDPLAVLPANTTLTSGVGSFQVTLKTTGSQTITGTDTVTATITGNTGPITVSSTTATHFVVSAPPSATAGTAVSVTVGALDQFNNLVTGYNGTVHFTSTDAQAILPANSTLTSGVGVFQVTLKTAGNQTVTATDTVTSTINGTSNTIAVGAFVTTHLLISAPGTITAGTPFNIIVTALDQFSNIATGYTGTVHFTSTDGAATLPVNVTLINGTNTLSVTLKTVGTQTITGTDTVTSSITGTSNPLTVTAATLQNIAVTPANPSIAKGLTQQFTATGMFSDGSLVDITSQVTWNSTTPAVATISATGLATAAGTGTSNITASLLGVTSPIDVLTVTAAVLQSITVTPGTPTVAAGQTLQFTATGHFSDGTTGAASVNWTSADATIATVDGSGLVTGVKAGGPVTITATFAANAAIFGTASLTVAPPIGFAVTGNLNTGHTGQTSTLLVDGRVLIAGGLDPLSNALASAVLFNPGTGTFTSTGSMTTPRFGQTATLLPNGKVLLAGGAPAINTSNGQPLSELASAELYDPATGTFTAVGNMSAARLFAAASLLPNGKVLVAGGRSTVALNTAEVFDPSTNTFSPTGNLTTTRFDHTATLLNNGTVILAAGIGTVGSGTALSSAEIYDQGTGTFTATGSLNGARYVPTATLLDDGTVLYAGGFSGAGSSLSSAELYNPVAGTFASTGSMTVARALNTATLLNNGTVLCVGGDIYNLDGTFLPLPSAEIYDPAAKTFTLTGSLNFAREGQSATLLTNGLVLIAGGDNQLFDGISFTGAALASAELYTPSTFTQPGLTSIAVTPTTPSIAMGGFQQFTATGTFTGGGQQTLASVTWSSSNPVDVSITNDATDSGRAFGLAAGSVTITACEGAVCGSTGATVPATLQSITVAPTSASVAAGLTQAFTATGHFSDGTSGPVSVNWSSGNTAIATINASGVATGVAAGGPITITATSTTNAAISGTAQLTVTAAVLQTITVAPTAASVTAGLTQAFTATGHFSDGTSGAVSVNWSSSNTAIATINASGVATGVAAGGPITITATSAANPAIFGTAQLTVTAAGPVLQTITVTPANPTLATNGTQAFIAIGQFSDGTSQNLTSTVTWASATTTVATINAAGVATGVSAGTSTISATQGAVTGSTVLSVTATTARAYVGDAVSAVCCLDVVDTSTNQIVKQIPITNINEPMGITPDQSRVYVPDNVLSVLDVVDTATNTLVNTIPVGNGTTAVVISPNGQFGYVSSFNDNNVDVFNVATSAVVATVPISFPAGWISITPDGSLVYAGSAIDGRVAVINTSSNTLSTTFTLTPPAGQPAITCVTGPTFNPQGTLGYIALLCGPNNTSGSTIDVISIPNNTLVTAITVGSGPFQSVMSPDGTRLYVANFASNSVSVINTATNTVIATVPVAGHAESIAITPDGAQVYVADTNAKTVSVIQTSTNTVTTSIATTIPFGIVIASPPAASAATTLTLTPSDLIFAPQVDGTLSAAQTINVKNPGATQVSLTSISLTGPNIGDFRLTNGCPIPPATLGAGASCNLQLSTDPTTNGPRTALVTINSTNGVAPSTQSAPLSATGISLVSIAVTPVNPSVVATNTVQFTATGTFSDNSTQNLTNSVTWTSSSTGIATINATGLATGVAAGGPITITATSGNIFGTTQLTVTPLVTFPLNVTLIGTGTGSVTDNLGSINCVNTAGVISGTCSANYPVGTIVNLTASATQPSTFGGWLQACSGTAGCSVTMNSAQAVTASLVPPPQAVPLPLAPGTNVTAQAPFDCPSNPNPTPGNPCLDTNAHAAAFTIGQVLTPFTLTVVATEVPPTNGNGICENGLTPAQDLDCRFTSFFTFQTKANGDTVVPLCFPYANGNCVVYSVFFQNPGQEPDPSMYVGPVNWNITFNNDTFVPPAPWAGSTPQLYYDPSGFVVPNSPYGTDCTTPMLIGNPGVATNPAIFCQFVFDITTIVDPTKKVDLLIGGKTKVFSDAIVAFPPVFAPEVTITTTPDAATVTAGSPIGFTITVSNSAQAVANNVSLNTPLPGGTNVNWSISPAYAGPGTCSITGAQGSQVLSCAFGTLAQGASASLHILSASSAAGTAISPSTVLIGSQQLLSIGSIVVQPIPVTFSGLTPSQTIPAGTSSVTLGGVVGNGTQFAPSGETVSITINGNKQTATIGSNGTFSLQFPTANIPASMTPYPITYSYAGDSLLSSASDSSTTLTAGGGGEPKVSVMEVRSGTNDESFFVDLRFTNSGNGVARNLKLNSVTFKTLLGRGNVTLNTARSPKLPDNLGSLNVGASVTVRLYLSAPPGVPRFLMTESGTVGDIAGRTLSYSTAETISATGRDREPGRSDVRREP